MKKILAMLFSALILLSACTESYNEKAELYKKGFKSNFQMTFRGYDLMGNLQREQSGIFYLELVKPDDLKGLTVSCEGDESIISFNGTVINSYENEDIEASFATALYRVFTRLAHNADALTFNGDKITGVTSDGEFIVITDDDGKLKSIEIVNVDLKIDFSDFEFKD